MKREKFTLWIWGKEREVVFREKNHRGGRRESAAGGWGGGSLPSLGLRHLENSSPEAWSGEGGSLTVYCVIQEELPVCF